MRETPKLKDCSGAQQKLAAGGFVIVALGNALGSHNRSSDCIAAFIVDAVAILWV